MEEKQLAKGILDFLSSKASLTPEALILAVRPQDISLISTQSSSSEN